VTFRNRAPGPQLIDVRQVEEVLPALERALGRPPEIMRAIRNHAAAIHPQRDGRSSERVLAAVDALVQGGRQGLRRKPVNAWRRLQARWRLRDYAGGT
jgi:hypothetical protein